MKIKSRENKITNNFDLEESHYIFIKLKLLISRKGILVRRGLIFMSKVPSDILKQFEVVLINQI